MNLNRGGHRPPAAFLGLLVGLVAAFAMIGSAAAAAPTITSVTPSRGPLIGGTLVTITASGGGFTGTTGVTFGSLAAAFTFVNDTTITATTPAHAAGAVDVVVNGSSGTATATGAFTYAAAPTISSVSPGSGPALGGTGVTIIGTGLTGATAVSFGGTNGSSVIVANDNTLTVVTPSHIANPVTVTVTTPGGTSAASAGSVFTFTAGPIVTGLSPSFGAVTGGTMVTVVGSGFTGATSVTFGGVAGTSLAVTNDNQLSIVSPAHLAGLVDVVVSTPAGSSAITVADHFTYGSTGSPVVTSVTPASGPVGMSVTISGSGFTGATAVTFGGVAATTASLVNDTTITATAPSHAAGLVDVQVTTPLGTSIVSAGDQFTYSTGGPVVTTVSPASGPVGTSVTITGSGFTGATSVTFGGVVATSATLVSDTSITAVAPAHAAGVADVQVTTPLGTSAIATADQFTYTGAGPVVTSISPTSGGAGTVVTITGTGFTGATSVTFGGTAATPSSVSDTQIVVTAPTHAGGAVDVLVVTPGGTSGVTAADQFTYGSTTFTYTLNFRWSLVVWNGHDGMSVANALHGQYTPTDTVTNDIYSQVTAIFRWNGTLQKWEGYFPGSESIPGAVDFTTFTKATAYWVAITGPNNVTWTVEQG